MTEHAEVPPDPMDEVEQDGKGESAGRVGGSGRGAGRRAWEKGDQGRSRVGRLCSPHTMEGLKREWPNPLLREYLAFGILSTFPPGPTLLLPSFIPEIQRTQGHTPPPGTWDVATTSKEDASP